MKAVVVREFTEPQKYFIEDHDLQDPGPGQLAISVHAAAVNFGDFLFATGRYQVASRLPFVIGSECSGVVEVVGEGVMGYSPGDHVAACGFVDYPGNNARILGSFAERIVVPVKNVAKAPPNVPLDDVALFRVHTETSYYALQQGRLAPGETLVVCGASGATGFAAVQLGKLMGAHVIASASTQEKRDIALSGGADVAIDSNDPHWRALVMELTDQRGIDVVFDPVGGKATERSFRSLAWGGRLLVIGFTAGMIPSIPVNLAMLKGTSLIGVNLLEAQRRESKRFHANSKALMDLFGLGKLKVPPIVRRYSLAEAPKALEAAVNGRIAGRMIIDVAGGR